MSRGPSNTIVLQGRNKQDILQVRAKLLYSMLNLWKRNSDGWIVELAKNRQRIDDLLQRLQQLEELKESTTTNEFVTYVEELLDINQQLSNMFE